jgi:hypothetical protein
MSRKKAKADRETGSRDWPNCGYRPALRARAEARECAFPKQLISLPQCRIS